MRTAGPTPATSAGGRRELILTLLRAASDPLSIAEIAEAIGVHPNTVRFHLDALLEAGRIEPLLGPVTGPGRPPTVYRSTRSMDRNGRSNYRLLAAILTAHLASTSRDPAGDAADLGRDWGPSLVEHPVRGRAVTRAQALTGLTRVLEELGFEPEPLRARTRQVRLRHCPFLDLVDEHADVVCALHLGLMQGVLAEIDGPVTVDRLVPFAEPDRCVAHLAAP